MCIELSGISKSILKSFGIVAVGIALTLFAIIAVWVWNYGWVLPPESFPVGKPKPR